MTLNIYNLMESDSLSLPPHAKRSRNESDSLSLPPHGKRSRNESESLWLLPHAKRSRNWQELPAELMSSILMHVGAFDMLLSARKVCKRWRSICSDPAMWRVIDLSYSGYVDDIAFYVGKIARKSVDLSCGKLIDFRIDYFGDNDLLRYVTNRSSQLRRLHLSSCHNITNEGLSDMVKKLPLLEELLLHDIPISKGAIEVVGLFCPMLQTFKLSKSNNDYCRRPIVCDVGALAIAENMPGLRHLQLSGHRITVVGLLAILDNCPHLESLEMRLNVGNLEPDLVRRLSKQIKVLRLSNVSTKKTKSNDYIDCSDFSNSSVVSHDSVYCDSDFIYYD